ncbi:MAG: NTP transferase domain-containing protein [candidate division Zixibacteria bacterium]|nr:NTP transferase domain-containing protein [candidate division Zixibacteria bacterium]
MTNVIIPAAGIGSRLRPHTHTLSKALLPVAGKPILGHIIDRLVGVPNLGTVWIVVGFLADQIESYVTSHYDLDVRFVHQSDLRGLGYAIHLALKEIPSDDPLLVILGDTIIETSFATFMAGPDEALGVREVADPRRFGVVEVEGGWIKRLVEKPEVPPSHLAVVGLYGIKNTGLLRDCLDTVVSRNQAVAGELQVTDALQLMVERGSRMAAITVEGWYDCGKLETMLLTNRHLLDQLSRRVEIPGSLVLPPSYVSPTARLEHAIVGPYASIGDRAEIVEAIVSNSIVSEGASIRRCVIEDSMIGSNANVVGGAEHLNIGDSSEVGFEF